jgi:medium-chain acyl-[acyl-carrier-protein] hydrolase
MGAKGMSDWVAFSPARSGQHKANLVCFPYAGGGIVAYHAWIKLIPADFALLRLQLPGRERRFREAAMTALTPLVEATVVALEPWLDRPFAFYGHSMGALIAFEVARRLRALGKPLPFHLFVSSFRAPHLANTDQMIAQLPTGAFIERLQQYQGIAPAIVDNEEAMAIYLPILRADFSLLASYRYSRQAPLPCPITAFCGQSDPKITAEAVEAWSIHTSADFTSTFFPGGHFFINDFQQEMLAQINRTMPTDLVQKRWTPICRLTH